MSSTKYPISVNQPRTRLLSNAIEKVALMPWNKWHLKRGITGTYVVESVALILWNHWHICRGISGTYSVEGWHLTVESVALIPWNTHKLFGNAGYLQGLSGKIIF